MDRHPQQIASDSNRGEGRAPSNWQRWLLPSITDLIFALLLAAMTYGALAPRLLSDASIGWHIRNGELILKNHAVPHTDPFSGANVHSQSWFAWEWLYDSVIAVIHSRTGLNGVVGFTALVVGLTFALVFRWTLLRGGNLPVTGLFLALALGASAVHLQARPHVMSWLFTVLWFQVLDSSETANTTRHLFFLPLLMLLWVNVHGGFVVGFVLLGVYLAEGFLNYLRHRDARGAITARLKSLSLVTGLSAVVSLVNPYGYKLHAHVYAYLSDRWLMNHIDEFLSPNFHGIAQQCFVVLLLLTILALFARPEELRMSQLLVVIFAAYSGLYASRSLPVSSLLLTLIMAPILSRAVVRTSRDPAVPSATRNLVLRCSSFFERMQAMNSGLRGHLWPMVVAVLIAVTCFRQGKLGPLLAMNSHFDAGKFPVEAAEVIAQHKIAEPIFSLDPWGGYLIYRLYPGTRVYVDDRHDFYGDQFLKNYLKVIQIAPDWQSALAETKVRWVLVPDDSALANILRETPQWRMVHEDRTAALFEYTAPDN